MIKFLDKICSYKLDKDKRHYCLTILGFKMKFKRKTPFEYYCGKKVYSGQESNTLLSDMIKSNQPFLATRFGKSELFLLNYYFNSPDKENIVFPEESYWPIRDLSGFFLPTNDLLLRYCKMTTEIIKNADLIFTIWYGDDEENALKYAKDSAKFAHWLPISSSLFYCSEPWTQYLEGKKVLVIHPFEKTIKSQHKIYEKLFKNPKLAPKYELLTLKTIQTLGNGYKNYNFKNWFEALEYMYDEIDKKDFDIAIVSGGAYSFFLANHIKEIGKQAINMCGATQLLFGIKGQRWDSAHIYNDYWVRPEPEDLPKNLDNYIRGEGNLAYW